MYNNITLCQSVNQQVSRIFFLLNLLSQKVFPTSHNTIITWIIFAFTKKKIIICTLVTSKYSYISISFDAWSSNNDLLLLGIIAHFLDKKYKLKTLLLRLLEITSYSNIEQSRVFL